MKIKNFGLIYIYNKLGKVISLVLLPIIILQFFTIYGCNKEENPIPPEQQNQIQEISGTINANEIGGSNLTIWSAFKQNSFVSNQQYTTKVSKMGTQLLFVTDGNHQLRGLTLSKLNNQQPLLLNCDAISTAYSLLFLSPGIATINSDSTNARMNRFSSLTTFQNLVIYLRNNLPSSSLTNLISQNQTKSLIFDCISEYTGIDTLSNLDTYENFFSVQKISDPNYDKFELKNNGWRFAKVIRRDIITDNQPPRRTEVIFDPMNGIVPLSIGSIFSLTTGNPTTEINQKSKETDITKYEFWVLGPGFKNPIPYPLPNDIQRDYWKAILNTMIFYVAFPIIDLISGGLNLINKTVPEILSAVNTIRESIEGGITAQEYANFMNSGSFQVALGNSLDLGIHVLSLMLTSGILVTTGIITAESATILIALLAVISLPLVAANLILMVSHYFITYDIYKHTIFNTTGGLPAPDLISPTNGSIGLSLGPTLVWNSVSSATSYTVQVSADPNFSNFILIWSTSLTQYTIYASSCLTIIQPIIGVLTHQMGDQ
jgi:hypothetical protein